MLNMCVCVRVYISRLTKIDSNIEPNYSSDINQVIKINRERNAHQSRVRNIFLGHTPNNAKISVNSLYIHGIDVFLKHILHMYIKAFYACMFYVYISLKENF